jgi:cytochrome c
MRLRTACRQLAVAVLAAALTAHPAPGQDMRVRERHGEAVVAKNCARCHAIGRTGASPHPAAPPFRTLSHRYAIDTLSEALGEGLSVGHPDMPEFVFAPGDIAAIITYLRSIQER